ncbi:MAG: tRNA threonylcarbamoyladenosine biosynthesis protein TsaE [Bacteroidia bacterium]|nr:tRNA threonylcarbamoyladenosine biosynthesis protein TsaE [Bacteroidia bacterium]
MTATSTQKTVLIKSQSLSDLGMAAQELLTFCGETKVITFTGTLGAGKTTFIKAICRQLGVIDPVSSPTFSIINEYRNSENLPVYHFDFYRIKTTQEADNTGCADYFFSGNWCFIEWPQLVESLLPDNYVKVEIENTKEIRTINATLINRA